MIMIMKVYVIFHPLEFQNQLQVPLACTYSVAWTLYFKYLNIIITIAEIQVLKFLNATTLLIL